MSLSKKMLSKYFSEHEAIWLPSWNRPATPKEMGVRIEANLAKMAKTMDKIREFFDKPIIVTSWFRPAEYNKLVGGAPFSYHREGLAVDFRVQGIDDCDLVRKKLLPMLSTFGIRMEDKPGSNWVHVDLGMPQGGRRFFKP